jgi:hypothetical protein
MRGAYVVGRFMRIRRTVDDGDLDPKLCSHDLKPCRHNSLAYL